VKPGRSAPAGLPPAGLPGLDPSWSRIVETFSADGTPRRWHVLDNGVTDPVGTLLAVHGNPTWSYLWRGLLAGAPEGWRVVAPDHLGMGWSERVDRPHRLADRNRRSRSALVTTDTLLSAIAVDATIGLSTQPVIG
jgi:pimeloyl-ACP methyl ester carboxylesterase